MMLMLATLSLSAVAQKVSYQTIARCARDMKTQDYGRVQVSDIRIVKDGNSAVWLGADKYSVVTVDRNIQTDSIQSVQYTTLDSLGQEFVVIFNHDIYNSVPLMRYQVILFDANKPYDWTYYFAKEPENM